MMVIHTEEILKRRGLNKGGRVQKFIDSEVLRYCSPLTPWRTGHLADKAAGLGSVIGSGIIKYAAEYARKQYYENGGYGKEGVNNGGSRGRLWFKRMKGLHLQDILKGLRKICQRR